MRALEACGDGFWECDLLDGSAWFSDWFYRKLSWSTDTKRATLLELQPLLQPATWDELMCKFRDHLERGVALDLKMRVQVAGDQSEWWHIRGSAQRNDAGQPTYLAGSVRDVSLGPRQPEAAPNLLCLRDAFDALPVAAALLDARSAVLEANRLWREFPERDRARVITRLQVANALTGIEFWLDRGTDAKAGTRLGVRASPFQHNGSRHLVVTLEDRSGDELQRARSP
jgi:PAS domain-containing protein